MKFFITNLFYLFSFISLLKSFNFIRLNKKMKSFAKLNSKLPNYILMHHEYKSIDIIFDSKNFDINNKINSLYAYYDKINKKIKIKGIKDINNSINLISYGVYNKSRFEKGWDEFRSETYAKASPLLQCYSVGIIEGILSQKEIYYYMNNFDILLTKEDKLKLKDFIKKVDEKIKEKIIISEIIDSDYNITQLSYISCIYLQLLGIFKGYKLIENEEKKKDLYDLYLINMGGNFEYTLDYLRINNEFSYIKNEDEFFKEENLENFYNTSKIEEIWKKLIKKSHCSVLVKYIKNKNGKNIFIGHNTWSNFNELLRVYKKISYEFEGENRIFNMKPFNMHFSSYPGLIFSSDEYYVIDKNLVITQTSLSNINAYAYKNLIDINKYIPEFIRLMLINMLSNTSKQWVENYYSINKNKHLYEASFTIIDYNNINKKKDLIYIVEDLPGSVKYIDYTKELIDKGYYGSFNLPFFKDDHGKKSGLLKYKDINFFENIKYNPRQYICDNLLPNVTNINEFKELLIYNKYKMKSNLKNDPSINNPMNGIAARSDFFGTIDFKIIDLYLIKNESSLIYCGPINRNVNGNFWLRPFIIDNLDKYTKKYTLGYPKVFNFNEYYFH